MDTIKSNTEISELFATGKRISNKYLTCIYRTDSYKHGQTGRVAFIAGKRNGNAVWRNRAKRRMREMYRTMEGNWKDKDVLFIAKPSLTDDTYSKVLLACEKTLMAIHE